MRNKFYIKSLKSISKTNIISEINFIDGLNIIHGPSNTGKSLIIRSIDYMFGAKDMDGLDDQTYLEMEISSTKGKLILKRNIHERKNYIKVTSSIKGIESKNYKIKGENSISDVWLSLIGIKNSPIRIIKNGDYKTQNLTWRTFSHMFLLNESEIIRETPSIILPKYKTNETAFLSCLDFLITGIDHSELEILESPENKKIKKQAVKDYIDTKIQKLYNYKTKKNEEILNIDKKELENRLNDAIDNFNYDNNSLKKYTKENNRLIKINHNINSDIEENSVSLVNFNNLLNQYQVDINRLTLIVEGNIKIQEYEEDVPCPFCNTKIPHKDTNSYIKDSNRELEIIKNKITDINSAIENLNSHNKDLENKYETNLKIIESNNEQIENILKPKITELKETIKKYNYYFNYLNEIELINKISKEWNSDLIELDDDKIQNNKYKPKDKLPSNFYKDLNNIIKNTLEECSYPELMTARLDKSSFDIVVNGKSKASQGKGYRAYLNTILALSLRKYLYQNAIYYNPIFVSDTPLLGLDEKTEPGIISMRIALHHYFKTASSFGQIIIADNNRDLPEISFNAENINFIEFTKSKTIGRYGFINGVID